MANSLQHSSVGTSLTQTEWEAIDKHVFESQATGDLLIAESASSLQRLGISGTATHFLGITAGKPAWKALSYAGSDLTGTSLASGIVSSSLTSVGTIATGVWQGTDVGVAYGGTGVSTLTDGGVLLGSGTGAITAMAVLADGEFIVGDGSTDPVAESGATLRTSIGVGTGDAVEFAGITGTTGTFSGAVDIQGGYANGGGAPYDGVVDVGGGGNWTTIQAGDDALDGGDFTMLVKGGTYTAGVTVSTGEARIVVEPGTVIQGAIVLSGDNVTLELGAGCDVQSTVTLSGNNCSLICQNGVDLDGIIVSGNFGFVDGGGWDTLSHGGSANDGISVSGTDTIVQNISAQTSGGGYDACESSGERTTFDKIKVVGADRFGFLASADEVKILNSVIADSGSENIFSNSTEGLIAYNYCNSAGLDGIECDDSGDNSVIIGNTVRDQASDSIELSAACENCVVVGNRTDGAIADNSGTSTVTGNDETAF
jgi:hypothetical protein